MEHIKLSKDQRTSLISKIYNKLMESEDMDMFEMGEAMDESTNLVDSWAEENGIVFE